MPTPSACIIGGGFYGCAIALFLKQVKGVDAVSLYEQDSTLLSRASYTNQARVHNGYHYPRSFTTAYRSHANFARFTQDWACCIKKDFSKYYALARRNSKVTGLQFQRFCAQIDAPLQRADPEIERLFNPALIEKVFQVEEFAFDADVLRDWFTSNLHAAGITLHLSEPVIGIRPSETAELEVETRTPAGTIRKEQTSLVFNCTYSGLGQIKTTNPMAGYGLKHEIAELALIRVPEPLSSVGITVMDGPFFSVMPFPARSCHSLSHVRYTPHCHWEDTHGLSPYGILASYSRESRVDRMLRDACRYIPSLSESQHLDSLFEVKTVLSKNETDDGRPILFREDQEHRGMYSILGSKIDNIYDILAAIDSMPEWKT